MFILSQYLLNITKVCQPNKLTTYSMLIGIILYSIIYLYMIYYNYEYISIFNKFIFYIIVIDLILSIFYYYSQKNNLKDQIDDTNDLELLDESELDESELDESELDECELGDDELSEDEFIEDEIFIEKIKEVEEPKEVMESKEIEELKEEIEEHKELEIEEHKELEIEELKESTEIEEIPLNEDLELNLEKKVKRPYNRKKIN